MWPDIPYQPWRETCTALHLYTQVVGKYRLARTPWINHSWHATLYVNARGLTTSLVPQASPHFWGWERWILTYGILSIAQQRQLCNSSPGIDMSAEVSCSLGFPEGGGKIDTTEANGRPHGF